MKHQDLGHSAASFVSRATFFDTSPEFGEHTVVTNKLRASLIHIFGPQSFNIAPNK